MEELITKFSRQDLDMLLKVSYELLKLQAVEKNDTLIDELLNGLVQPDIIRIIINSNYYNKKTGVVEPKPDKFFRLAVGDESELLQY